MRLIACFPAVFTHTDSDGYYLFTPCPDTGISFLETGINPMLAPMLFCLVIMVVCGGIPWIPKKIPGLNKLL